MGPRPMTATREPHGHVRQVDGVERDPERFEEGGFVVPDAVRHGKADSRSGQVANVTERAVGPGIPGETGGRAELDPTAPTRRTSPARHRRIGDHSLAATLTTDHDAHELVAQHQAPVDPMSPPIEPSSYQWRSEPHNPTATTRSRTSVRSWGRDGFVAEAKVARLVKASDPHPKSARPVIPYLLPAVRAAAPRPRTAHPS